MISVYPVCLSTYSALNSTPANVIVAVPATVGFSVSVTCVALSTERTLAVLATAPVPAVIVRPIPGRMPVLSLTVTTAAVFDKVAVTPATVLCIPSGTAEIIHG